jgi:hypothetical protein
VVRANRYCGSSGGQLFCRAFLVILNTYVSKASERFSRSQRVTVALCGLGLVTLLGVATVLRPSETGLGTHEQLGLPPCTFRWLFGMRCPSCGMTTSWSHVMRGQWRAALSANVGGTLLAGVGMAAAPWCILSAACGRWVVRPPSDRVLAAAALVIAAVTLVDWACRLAAG